MKFPMTYPRMLARELALDAKGQEALLAGTRLSPEDLLRLDGEEDQETIAAIVRNALALSGNPALGLRWGSQLHIASHGPLGQLIAVSPTVAHSWRGIERFHELRGGFASVHGVAREDGFAVVVRLLLPSDEVGLFFLEAMLANLLRNFELITSHERQNIRIELAYPAPVYAEQYLDYLGYPCRFDMPETAVVIPVGLGSLVNPLGDAEAYQQAWQRCEELTQAQRQRESWTQRVSDLLNQNPGQIWTSTEVAGHFHLSSRTLMRHLKEEGCTYQALLDAELGRQAKRYLESSRYTVESVALTLGYQEVSNFRRAFKRWFGISPSDYIEQHRRT